MRSLLIILFIILNTTLAGAVPLSANLAGEWSFRLDPANAGVQAAWFNGSLPNRTRLPGSTDENHYGTPNTRKPDYNTLSRLVEYCGAAWYQREITIPTEWSGKRVTLVLERCHWETRAWVDGRECGMSDSLCVAHIHDLGSLKPGIHRLTLRIDNTLKYDMGGAAHSTSEQTQTNWNGVVGRIELRATDPVWIEDLQVYPDVPRHSAKVKATIGNATGIPSDLNLELKCFSATGAGVGLPVRLKASADGQSTTLESEVKLGSHVQLWDEFNPALYKMTALLVASRNASTYSDQRSTSFGMRDLKVVNKRITLNNRPMFLRGTLECCIFPKTGYPATDIAAWLRILRICKSYGLNHMRFHSWCPPEAAFEAADKMGFLLHVEAPQWTFDVGKVPPRDAFIEQEVRRILTAYGNHPSFGMLCMGNELGGDPSFLQKLVLLGKQLDKRHLYTPSTAWSFGPNDDYNVAAIRGLHGPGTDADFREADARSRVPIISHEIGQWTVYPNLREIPKYTGVLRARNFELVRDDLRSKGMLDLADAFTQATGKLSCLLYKEEMEVLFRTPGHGGFQLLDLHDFPGQGTALVGALDAFWDSKGLIKPSAFRRYCGPTVPLLRMKKRCYTSDEEFVAQMEIAHFGPRELPNAVPLWTLTDDSGRVVESGAALARSLPTGALTPVGEIKTSLANVHAPTRLTVTVFLKGTTIGNDWNIWVYPPKIDANVPSGVIVARDLDDSAKSALASGKSVLLLASSSILSKSLPGSFTPVFWSPVWFNGGAGTMSILCDPAHPALAQFPTESYTDWQWYDLLNKSRSMILDDVPAIKPIVRMIDNFSRNHHLAVLFEARVGAGKLLVCSINLTSQMEQRPAARQLLHSLLSYMDSPRFSPQQELSNKDLSLLFHPQSGIETMLRAPSPNDKPVLSVRAAVRASTPNKAESWTLEADEVLACDEGFGYSVRGGTWRDDTGAAWHDTENLVVTVNCPKGFQGTLYANFQDWNNLGRVAEVLLNGRSLGSIEDYNGPGKWIAIPVTPQESSNGVLELSARPTVANVMISEIVLVRQK